MQDSLASEAEASGLLEPEIIAGLLRDELRRRRVDQLFEASEQLAKLSVLPLTEAEVETEIKAARENRQ